MDAGLEEALTAEGQADGLHLVDGFFKGFQPCWPFQSDHSFGSDIIALMVPVWFPVTSARFTGFDHQNCV